MPAARVPQWDNPVRFLPKILLEPKRPAHAILVGWLAAFLPSIALGAIVQGLLPSLGQPQLAVMNLYMVALIAVAAPIIETLLMAGLLALLLRFTSPTVAVLFSSAAWGIAHSLAAPAWGLVIWWPFLIFSILYVTWRQRSLLAALAMPASVHALQNLLPSLLLLAQSAR